jgi:hypothetical protein
METVVTAITAAADKTTAVFFMGFPFTKIKRQAKGILPIEAGNALSIASSFARNSQPEQKTANRKFVPAKYEIVNFMSAFDSGR